MASPTAAGTADGQGGPRAAPFHIVLVAPEIPPNTGNIARLCAATRSVLHLVDPLGFRINDATLKRAGLDYWEWVDVRRHADFAACCRALAGVRLWFFSARATRCYWDVVFAPGDALVFGCESRGLPEEITAAHREQLVTIPMGTEHVRSLNLSTAAGVALYEAIRQTGHPACRPAGRPV